MKTDSQELRTVRRRIMADKSEYELERDRNMAENAQHLAALGIEPLEELSGAGPDWVVKKSNP